LSKILIVGPAFPLRGGLATYNQRLASEFITLGHQCDILSFSLQYPSILFPGKTQFSSDKAPEGIRIFSAINSINPFNWRKVGKQMREANYDIVIFRYWMSFMAPALGTIAKQLKKNKRTKILAITDNIIPHEKRFFDTAFTHYFLNQCDGFLTMSQSVLSQLKQLNQHKPALYTAHPMYDMFGAEMEKQTAQKKLGLAENGKYILFFGFIRKYKGLHLLLDAFADPRIQQLGIKLMIAGEFYEDATPYLNQIKELGLQTKVILSNDFIQDSNVSTYFCASDLVVQTYLDATQSGVTQIAYFYNKPMVVTNVGGLSELVPNEKVGYVVEVDKNAVADAIVHFYEKHKEPFFIENIKIEKQRFTWRYVCQQLVALSEEANEK